jgi:integrase
MIQRKTKRLKPAGLARLAQGMHADGDGLYLRVDEGGARSWVLRTMIQGKRRDMGLGSFPAVSLATARKDAIDYRRIAREGGNPFLVRDQGKQAIPSFKEAAEAVHAERATTWRNVKHRAQWIETLREYAYPALGTLRVDAIQSGEIMRAIGPIWLAKPETAKRVMGRIANVLLWAKGKAYPGAAPMAPLEEVAAARAALPKQTAQVKHHAAMKCSEVEGFISELRASEAGAAVKLALEFLILTAARSGEVRGATWGEIDTGGAMWTVPAERMKAKREHRVPLAPRCLEILGAARTLSDGKGLVFPGTKAGNPISDMTLTMLLRRRELKATAHGFRSTFRDWASDLTNYPRDVCEQALAHSLQDKTEAAYKRTDLFEKRRAMMDQWAAYCATKKGADVLPFPASKRA